MHFNLRNNVTKLWSRGMTFPAGAMNNSFLQLGSGVLYFFSFDSFYVNKTKRKKGKRIGRKEYFFNSACPLESTEI